MAIRGIRGATTVAADTPEAIRAATRELLEALVAANHLQPDDIASVIFSTTADLTAEVPARAARELGWVETGIMCLAEMDTAGGLPRCLRVLVHWNTELRPDQVRHVYLHAAAQLRPDRVNHVNHQGA